MGIRMGTYERVMELCAANNVKQTVLEDTLGFSKGSIGKMQKSEMLPSRLLKIADFFHVSLDYLVAGRESSISSIPIGHTVSDFEYEIIKRFRSLSSDKQGFILDGI